MTVPAAPAAPAAPAVGPVRTIEARVRGWLKGPNRTRLFGAGAALALFVGLVINESNPRRVSTPADLAAAAELVSVLDKGQAGTYHARFESMSPDGKAVFELWRRPPDLRQRVETMIEGVAERSEVIVTASDVISCTQSGDGPWSCSSSPELRGSLDALGPIPEGALDGERVERRRTTIAGEAARCFTVEVPAEGTSEVCVTDDGIPLLLTSDGARTELLSLERTVDPGAFDPPAPPVATDAGLATGGPGTPSAPAPIGDASAPAP